MIAPLAIAAGIFVCCVLRARKRGEGTRAAALEALPWLLSLSFLVYPMISSAAFLAFSCETFDDGRAYLRVDYSVECGTAVHARAKLLAWLGSGGRCAGGRRSG